MLRVNTSREVYWYFLETGCGKGMEVLVVQLLTAGHPQKCESMGPGILFKLLYTATAHKAGSAEKEALFLLRGAWSQKAAPPHFSRVPEGVWAPLGSLGFC